MKNMSSAMSASLTRSTSATMRMVHGRFERLSRRIALSGLMSRSEAESLIRTGEVYVDGRVCTQNPMVHDGSEVIVRDTNIPCPDLLPKLWALRKPRQVHCSFGRPITWEEAEAADRVPLDGGATGAATDGATGGAGAASAGGATSSDVAPAAPATSRSRSDVGGRPPQHAGVPPNTATGAEGEKEEGDEENARLDKEFGERTPMSANLTTLFENFRTFDQKQAGPKHVDNQGDDCRLLSNFSVVTPLKWSHSGIVLVTNDGKFCSRLQDRVRCPIDMWSG